MNDGRYARDIANGFVEILQMPLGVRSVSSHDDEQDKDTKIEWEEGESERLDTLA